MIVSFAMQKLFNFMRSWLLIVHLINCGKGVLFRKSFLVTMSSRLFSNLSSIRLSVSGLMLGSLIHFEWSWFLCRVISMDSSICHCPIWLASVVEDVSFSQCIFLTLSPKLRCSWVCQFMSVSLTKFHWLMCLFYANIISLFLLQLCTSSLRALLGFLCFCMKLKTVISNSVKNFVGILIRITLKL